MLLQFMKVRNTCVAEGLCTFVLSGYSSSSLAVKEQRLKGHIYM